MSRSVPERRRRETSAYAFLFDSRVDGLPKPQLPFFTAAVFNAVSDADPCGAIRAQLRLGLPSLLAFSERVTAVHIFEKGSGRTVSYDSDTYKLVIMQWLDALDGGWTTVDRKWGEHVFLRDTCECVAISALGENARDRIDTALRQVLGYVGGFAIDPGNPLHRGGFFDRLIYGAAIVDGEVVQERTAEGDEHWALEGAMQFRPGGLVWQDYGWLRSRGPRGLPKADPSDRSAAAASALARKRAPEVEQRVIEALSDVLVMNAAKRSFEFKTTGRSDGILEAIMPEGKFTHYLFDREHKDGGSKAAFIIDELGIEPADWRYLAAQFYFGLVSARPEAVKLNEWKDGYGVRFNVTMRVRGRSGSMAVLITGWTMKRGALPSLSTARPGKRDAAAVEPGDVPILRPGKRTDADWETLWRWANEAGLRDARAAVPTPMFIIGHEPIAEGMVGSAVVRVADARRGLARWLARYGPGQKDTFTGTIVFSPLATQSHDRAVAWARSVTIILRLNGIDAQFEAFKT